MELVFNGLSPRGPGIVPKMWDKPVCERVLALLGSLGQCAFAHSLHVEFGSSIPAETVKTCALIGRHMMAEENAFW